MNCWCDEVPDITSLCPIAFVYQVLSTAKAIQMSCPWNTTWPRVHPYSLAKKACVFTEHKPLVAIITKDMVTLSQCLQCIMLHIHHYRVQTIYKPDPYLHIVDWLF